MTTQINPLAGKPAPLSSLIDVAKLVTAYFEIRPDSAIAAQRVVFGTSGHRGSSFDGSFNEGHVLAITQAISVAGHLTIFLTRTRGPFWSIRPAKILLIAVFGTQAVATLIAVYGVFMTPLGWGYAGIVWGYALAWFLVNDRVKLLAYRIFDSPKAAAAAKTKGIASRAKAEANSDAKPAPAPEAKAETKQAAKAAPAPEPNPKHRAI